MKKWLIFFILTVQGATGAQEQMFFEPDVERTWHKMAGFGNLTGISIGGNYNPKNWLSLEAMAGFSLPYTPFMPAPYPGNQFTANLRLRLIHKTGLYLMSAYFLGSYEIRQNSGDVSVTEMSTIHAPQFA
ncbi:hypothetical protein JXO59_15475, partial [candidate division KSB1 bacterium]|nr:hypothetical protein [candidate division KSB1 bacterium]